MSSRQGFRKKLKRIFHGHKDGEISRRPSHAGPNAQQQSSVSTNSGSSYVAMNDPSAELRPVPASDTASPPQERPQEAPAQELLGPQENDNSIRQLWAVAYKSLRDEKDSPVQAFEDQIRRNLSSDIAETIESHANTKDWMSKVVQNQMDQVKRDTLKLRFGKSEVEAQDVVKSVLAVVDWSKDFVTKALSGNPTASIAWGGVSLLLPLFLNPLEQASSLAKGLEHISSLIVRSSMWEDLYVRRYEPATWNTLPESHAEYRRALEMLYREVLRFQIVCYGYYSHKSAARLALDNVRHHGWDELLEKIKYQETEFDKMSHNWRDKVYNEEWEKAETRHQEAMGQWRTIGTDVSELRKQVKEIQKDEKRKNMLEWLWEGDISVQYRAAREKYSKGICEWLVQEGEGFKLWERDPKSFLWLNGKAGSGKSILSSSVIKYLKDQYEQNPETALAYYFFSFGNLEQQKVSAMLSSLVRQLCASRPDTPQPIKRFEGYMEKSERPDIEALEAALLAAVSGFSAVFIVVDALDECPTGEGERSRLLDCLTRIITAMPDNLHIFCTSRAEPDIHVMMEEVLSLPAKAAIDLTQNRVKGEVKKELIAKADGMFQYLICQFEILKDVDSEALVAPTLHRLPDGLDETYNRLLRDLGRRFQSQVLSSLKWLALSRRPLHLDEFAEIFIFRPDTVAKIDATERLFDSEAVLRHFSSLLTPETKDEWNDEDRERRTITYVRLAHFTVKEYLMSERIEQSIAKEFYITKADADLHIAHCCLAYHLYQSAERTKHDENLPLKRYAVRNWELHSESVPRKLWTPEIVLLAERALYMRSVSLREILFEGQLRNRWHSYWDRVYNLMQRPYCYTAALGYLELTKLLLRKGPQTSRFLIQEDLDLALREAAEEGRIEMVRFFLDKRDATNERSQSTGGALQAAAYEGHEAGIKLLLNRGADIDAHDDRFGSALQAAAKGAKLKALRMLLDRGADVSKAGCPVSCLIAAYKDKDEKLVMECTQVLELLLNKGANINRKCTRHGSALNQAIRTWLREGTRSFFDFAVQHGADLELNDGRHGSPLQAACVNPSELAGQFVDESRTKKVVEVLLRLGADPNAQGGECGNALQKASYHLFAFFGVIELLLEKGAKINQQGGRYGTALHAACAMPNADSVNTLLAAGADLHVQAGEHGSVLHAAIAEGYVLDHNIRIAQKLLDSGANVNAHGGKFGSALQAAVSSEGRWTDPQAVEKLLLSSGAEVNAQGGIYDTALQGACVRGKMKSVALLLSRGAEVNIKGGRYETALQAACANEEQYSKEHCDLARLLIEHGADVHVQGGHFGSAWHAAAAIPKWDKQAHETLELLLDNGVDVNDCRSLHGTALQVALEHLKDDSEYTDDTIRFFIKHGADVNLGSGPYGFPLQSACLAPTNNPTRLNTRGLVYLLENCDNIDVNMTGGLFGTALQAAAYTGKGKAVKLLLQKGADVNIRGGKYRSALNAAVIKGYWGVVETLLDAGAEPDCHRPPEHNEEWLDGVGKEDGRSAVERYWKVWEELKMDENRTGEE
ncbi:putative ankyrin repeat protein [Colletotrichum fructicola]|nr:putative ankyrin repeat protein [Colletotrichum fructicola]